MIMMQDEQIVELCFQRNERALLETSDKYGNYCIVRRSREIFCTMRSLRRNV